MVFNHNNDSLIIFICLFSTICARILQDYRREYEEFNKIF